MGKALESIYLNLPSWVQNAAISAYGFHQKRLRHKYRLPAEYKIALKVSDKNASNPDVKNLQNKRLRALISHAATYVPHYTDLLKNLGALPTDINIDNFDSIFPVLEKHEVTGNPARFYSTTTLTRNLKLFTSGTSGSPMPILCTHEARALNYAYFKKIIEINDCSLDDRSITFAGRVLFSQNEKHSFWRKDFANNTLYCSSYYISPITIPSYINAIESWDPLYIDTYPSAIYEIARYINQHNVKHRIQPRFILTSSETLTGSQRSEIESAFGCKVVDQYGCTEMAVMAWWNGAHYEVEPLYSLVEFLPKEGAEDLAIVCTGLLNFGMPLIRYKIGDIVAGAEFEPAWRFQTASFKSIVGREDDSIVTPEGRRIGRMDPVFKGIEGISKAQIIQRETSSIEVLIVKENDSKAFNEEQLKRNIRNRTSEQMIVTITFVKDIPLTRTGKFKSVISHIR